MKKYLLLIAVLLFSQLKGVRAQQLVMSSDSLFFAPDTVCINQPVTLLPDTAAFNAQSYFWGFCSGYFGNAPTGVNLGNGFGFHNPTDVNIVEDSGTYYGFVVNAETNEFLRLTFGNSLTNTPTVTDFGNVGGALPVNPTSLYILQDTISKNWYVYVTGGFTQATSTIGRVDFGLHLNNPKPNGVNFGDYNGILNYPKGIFVAQDANNHWYGYVVNHNTSELIQLDFSFNESNTPLMTSYGNVGGFLQNPTDLAAVYDHGQWYFFVTNEGVSSWVTIIALTNTLNPSTTAISAFRAINSTDDFTFNNRILQPSSITLTRDCNNLYAYITDSTTSQLIGLQIPYILAPYYTAIDYNNVGGMNFPSAISYILRSDNNLNGFIVNPGDSSLTRISIDSCTRSSIPTYTEEIPPKYTYDTPGVYNIYLVINQGQPDMRVDCKTITVLPYPPLYINNDTTICQGDTVTLYAISTLADSFAWQSGYNIDTSYVYRDSVRVYPAHSASYQVDIYYPFGCIVDTTVHVIVNQVSADAGPDRWILDGATSMLGGPYTSEGYYLYHWSPFDYMSDSSVPNPVVNPPSDMTYYLTVTNPEGCIATDTVNVYVDCGAFYVPNAFAPNSDDPKVNTFGLINQNIVQLNYFRIFDRWGNQVFQTTNPSQGWDGTYNNEPQPVGVYVYVIDGFCDDGGLGRRVTKKGNVTLLR